jgi:DnaK suppressor protein
MCLVFLYVPIPANCKFSRGELFMPVRARKTVGTKRRKRRTTAAKPATARRKTTKRRKKGGTARAATPRRRRRKTGARATVRRHRRKTGAKRRARPGATRRRKTTRGRSAAVKKKPSKSKASQKTSESARIAINRKPRALKTTIVQAPAAAIWAITPKKKQQKKAKSNSQALPIKKQQPSTETKMAETEKIRKRAQKGVSLKTRLKSVQKKETGLNIAPYKERPGEDYMSADQLAHFRRLLLQQKRLLLEHMGRTVHQLQDEGVALADMSDRATQEEEFNLELRASDRERKLIKKIDNSLQQIDEKNYGFCNSCGVEIGIRRLEARPTASLCIDCKTLDEIREKQMSG